jgi:deoxycytidylate deaminase
MPIIGLTGSFGSGCTHITEKYLIPKGYRKIHLSHIIKELFRTEYGKDAESRTELQSYGNKLRHDKGYDFLAQEAIKIIEKDYGDGNWVIDSIKNINEVRCFRNKYSSFFLVGVFADYDIRWGRVKKLYDENEGSFRRDDKRDSNENSECGQQVRDCFAIADIVISNNIDYIEGNKDQEEMSGAINGYLALINKPSSRPPKQEEALMAMAYANSQRSSCQKRKVGSIIVDADGHVFSSGYNEVPLGERPCRHVYGGCYRDFIKAEIKQKYGIEESVMTNILNEFKNLDRCRALHAEENAIINVAKFGSSLALEGSTLYTTTYPCNLCANKIAQAKIKRVVYLEPYPMEEAKKILSYCKIEQIPFEGVSFKGYFKLFGGEIL